MDEGAFLWYNLQPTAAVWFDAFPFQKKCYELSSFSFDKGDKGLIKQHACFSPETRV